MGLVVVLLVAACSTPPAPPIGGDVRVLGSWEPGPELDAFLAVVRPFEQRTGYRIKYTPSRDLQRYLETSLKSGTEPDVAGLPGPWVTPEKYRLIERFKFFLDLGSKRGGWATSWLRPLARLRCERREFRWPVEMAVIQRLKPAQKLS